MEAILAKKIVEIKLDVRTESASLYYGRINLGRSYLHCGSSTRSALVIECLTPYPLLPVPAGTCRSLIELVIDSEGAPSADLL